MSVLILVDHDNHRISTATACAITAGLQLSPHIVLLVAGYHCQTVAEEAALLTHVEKVLWVDDPAHAYPLAENIAPLLASLGKNFSAVIAPATSSGKDILPRAAALMDIQPISEVIKIEVPNTFVRPIYAGNALETVQSQEIINIFTIRPTAFTPAEKSTTKAPIETINPTPANNQVEFISLKQDSSARPDLASARIVISGGRGVGSAENFKLLEQLADKLGAALGASRAAVDAGYAPNNLQVGQTGKIVAPDLYIAIGISGAIQHLAGIKDSKVIVAINKDENAPIFEIADYGLVADFSSVFPELQKAVA